MFDAEQATRWFGLITAGGDLGAIAGPLVTRELVREVGLSGLMMLAACGFALVIVPVNFGATIGTERGQRFNHVGLGADFDGIPSTPTGLEDVDKYPDLLAELAKRGWSDAQPAKVAGENILRVMAEAEAVSTRLRSRMPSEAAIEALDTGAKHRD